MRCARSCEVGTDEGLTGLGETYGDLAILSALRKVAPRLTGLDPFDLNGLERIIRETLGANGRKGDPRPGRRGE